jgi:hypothetical protein
MSLKQEGLFMDASPSVSAEIVAGDAITLIELARQYHTAPSTCFRWVRKGLTDVNGHRVFLEAVRRGKLVLTSSAAVARFFALLEYSKPVPPPIRTPTKRERDSAQVRKELQEQYGY